METAEYNRTDDEIIEEVPASDTEVWSLHRITLYIILAAVILSSVFGAILSLSSHPAKKSSHPSPHTTQNAHHSTDIPVPSPIQPAKDTRRRVLIDAGHGGFDPGTEGTQTGITESTVNLQIAQKVQRILEEKGYIVMMTRTDENAIAAGKNDDMEARCAIIQRSGADIFISIHQNAFDGPSVCGAEVYYHETKPDSRFLAECLERELSAVPGANPSRGVKTYGHMLTKYLRYSVLIECGFLTNPIDERMITEPDKQELLAHAIVRGIENFYDNYYKE